MVFLHFQTLAAIFEFYMASQSPRNPSEPSKNLPGARGLIFPKSRPIPSHGDPIHPKYYHFSKFL